MVLGTLEIALRLDGCFSLKEKRHILRGLLERTRRSCQVAIAEVGDQDLWNSAIVGVACVSNDIAHAESVLQHVIEMFDACPSIAVEGADKDIART